MPQIQYAPYTQPQNNEAVFKPALYCLKLYHLADFASWQSAPSEWKRPRLFITVSWIIQNLRDHTRHQIGYPFSTPSEPAIDC